LTSKPWIDADSQALLERPVAEAHCLPAAIYTDPEVLEHERQAIFGHGWVSVGFASQIPEAGDTLPVLAGGIPLVLVRGQDAELRVFHNICRHRGLQLVEEPCRGNRLLACPYHAWAFELDGSLRGTPYWDGKRQSGPDSATRASLALLPIRFEVWCDIVFVNVDGGAVAFEDFIAPVAKRFAPYALDQLRFARLEAFEVEANWKLAADNFLDNYHVPWVHAQAGPPESALDFELLSLSEDAFGFWMPQGGISKPKPLLPAFQDLPQEFMHAQHFLCLFPNTLIALAPTWFEVISLEPGACDATTERFALYLVGDEALAEERRGEREKMLKLLLGVNEQDLPILARLQRGRHSPASSQGRFAPFWDEVGLLFHRRIASALGSPPTGSAGTLP
jgi:choline monooxygenase